MNNAIKLYYKELKFFAKEARNITGSPMAKHMRVAVKSHAEHFVRKQYPEFRR